MPFQKEFKTIGEQWKITIIDRNLLIVFIGYSNVFLILL